MPPLCVSTIKQYKHYIPKGGISQWRAVKHEVTLTINCTSAGWLESETSSRSQDPNVRPQGIDYCQCFVMDVSFNAERNGKRERIELRRPQNRGNELPWWTLCLGDRSTLYRLLYWLRSHQITSVWVCAIITVTASPSPTQHRTVDEQTRNKTLNTVVSEAFVTLFFSSPVASSG